MIKKINDLLAGLPMTILSFFFLIASFILARLGLHPLIDPAWVTIVICGLPLLYLSLWRIRYNHGISKISSALLITIAMAAAIAIGDLFAAGEVGFIMSLGAILEDMTTQRSKKGLHKLLNLAPPRGRVLTDGHETLIPAGQIRRGDLLRILPGEAIPADGIILEGETSVDESIMTGESLPADKTRGDHVYCGTISQYGAIDIRATGVGEDSSLKKMVRLVEEAENNQAPMQRTADTCASLLVPLAALIALTAGFLTKDITRTVTVFVVFCPCALVLATPTAIMAAIGQATKHGIIIKSGAALEKLGGLDIIAFDKTGTLTLGHLCVSDVLSFVPELNENRLLALAAAAEEKSGHPLGKAIVQCGKERGEIFPPSADFRMTAGRGIAASVNGHTLLCGNKAWLDEEGIPVNAAAHEALSALQKQGKATILVADKGGCLGLIALTDSLRAQAAQVIRELKELKTRTILLTGDNEKAAAYFAGQAQISEFRANLLPQEKVRCIQELQEGGHLVCMVGDGVNDAPALKTADVGIAMASMGSDIAIEAADIALADDDISKILYLKRLSNATLNTIKTSIGLSMTINFVAVTLSVMGLLNPTTGALVHNAGSCLVVLIAALLYDRKFD